MELPLSSSVLGIIVLITILGVFLYNALRFEVDPREPPVIYPKIPIIVGMLVDGLYLKKLHGKHGHPIFALSIWPMGRTYVVASPEMVPAMLKAPPTLTFDTILSGVTVRMNNADPETARIIQDAGEDNLFMQYHKILTTQALNDGSDIQLVCLAELVNAISDGSRAELFDFENGLISMLIRFIPSITARSANNGLQALAEKFAEYEESGGHADAHYVIRARNKSHLQHGISLHKRSKLDASLGFAFNVNASIAAFWVLSSIYSRPDLLARLRDEIQTNALLQPATLSYAHLRDSCPGLYSVYREALRHYAPMSSVQWVKEDTLIANQYLVRKGCLVHAAGVVLHHDKANWGPDADSFNPDRFLHNTNGTRTKPDGSFEEKSNIPSAAFRSFGGGKHTCPGRHFAATEILTLSAVMILGFEMETVDKSTWNPPPDRNRAPITVVKPLEKLMVRMRRRQGYENVQWKLQL